MIQRLVRRIRDEGSLVQSSRFLEDKMIKPIDFSRTLNILELGCGKGGITRKIARRMSADSRLDVIERDVKFNRYLERVKRECADKQIAIHNVDFADFCPDVSYDYVVSSLPLQAMALFAGQRQVLSTLRGIRGLLEERHGTYIQYQYGTSCSKSIRRVFGNKIDNTSFVLLNVPPALVYRVSCR